MSAYNRTSYSPPAPEALVIIEDPLTRSTYLDVPMLIDSGADVTIIPRRIIDKLGITVGDLHELEGHDGHRSTAIEVTAVLVLEGRRFRGQFLSDEREVGIIGRNILNCIHVHLDGPNLTWHL